MSEDRKLLIRMSEAQHKALRVKAAELGRPMAEIVRCLLDLWLEGKIELSKNEQKGETPREE